jgi:LemA protein
MLWVIVVLAVIGLLVVALITLYNRFVRLRNRVDNAWAQIDVQLKRRRDLIPNLVETVKGYASHERETFEAVTEARAAAQRATTPGETAAAEGLLSQALGRLFAVAEAYPELQADENFRQLQSELSETENRIAVSRQVYNDTVLTYNNAIQTFPGVLLAGPFGFAKREFFEVDEAEREVPRVDFGTGGGNAPAPTGETTTS